MTKYIVNVREVHIQPYIIEAKDEQEAMLRVQDGEGDLMEAGCEYSHTLSIDTWTAEEE